MNVMVLWLEMIDLLLEILRSRCLESVDQRSDPTFSGSSPFLQAFVSIIGSSAQHFTEEI